MLDVSTILPVQGVLPPRPACLTPPAETIEAESIEEAIVEILKSGKCVVMGGLSMVGERLHFVSIVTVLRATDASFTGWILALNHPSKSPDFERIDTRTKPLTELPFPDTMIYFVSEVGHELVSAEVPEETLADIARFVLVFISDDGPPEGIGWSEETYQAVGPGTRVKTTRPNPAVRGWSDEIVPQRKWGVSGRVITHHDSHGLCYDVRHDDGSQGSYDPSELLLE